MLAALFNVDAMNDGVAELRKALTIGYGTDEAAFENGRALQVEDMELTMVNAMREQQEDFKLMNRIKRRQARATVHEYNKRTDSGEYMHLTANEGGDAVNTDQAIKRVTVEIKYLQTRRAVTDQALAVDTYESALAAEKMTGTLTVLKAAEYLAFHGDAAVVPSEYNGALALLEKTPHAPIEDARGQSIGTMGKGFFDKINYSIYHNGGDANLLFYPPVIAQDIQEMVIGDGVRYVGNASLRPDAAGNAATIVVDHYTSSLGNSIYFGKDAGADKLYRVKGTVIPSGDTVNRPEAPTLAASPQAGVSGSQFLTGDAGTYKYAAHGINRYGVSPASAQVSPAIAANGAVQLTITASDSGRETGYIITRTAKDGSSLMEMRRIGADPSGTTVFLDKNLDLPGTASALFLTEKRLQPIVEFYQLVPLRYRPLFESERAEKPFMIQLFGAVDLKEPNFCGLVKNIAYSGGLY